MARILVTGAGGPAAVSFMNALGDTDHILFAADMDPHATGLYLVPPERRALVPAGKDQAFVEATIALCKRLEIDVLVPTVDAELAPLAYARAQLEAAGVALLIAKAPALEICLDKWALHAAAEQAGIPVPATQLLDAHLDLERIDFPCIVKPRRGSGSRGVRICNTPADLQLSPRDGSMLVQELLPGEEYSIDTLCSAEAEPIAAVTRARLKTDSGVSVTSRTLHDDVLQNHACNLTRALGLAFVSNVQMKRRADGSPALLEINPRFPGTMALTVASGINMPRLAVEMLLGQAPPAERPTFKDLAMMRVWREVYVDPSEILTTEGETDHD